MNQKVLVVIAGKTCSGKSHLERALQARGFSRVISSTTRAPRKGEVHGIDYHFARAEEFSNEDRWIEKEQINGNFYGTSRHALMLAFLKSDRAVIVVDPKGANTFRKLQKSLNVTCLFVFMDVPEELFASRMVKRILDDGQDLVSSNVKRLTHAMTEECKWENKMLFASVRIPRYTEESELYFVNQIDERVNRIQGNSK